MASNKYSYIDGVPFAINPLFINDNQNANLLIESEQLTSSLDNALAIINSNYEFTLELKSLKSNDDKKKKKEPFNNSILNNKKLRHKNSTQNETTLALDSTQILEHEQPTFSINSINNVSSNVSNVSISQPLIARPLIPSSSYSVLLEPIRNDNSIQLNKNEPKTSQVNLNNHKDIFIDSTQSLDPFNDCELKTINDFEELKTILNNHQFEQQKQYQQQQQQTEPVQFFLTNSKACPVDSFGLPIVDLNSNKIK